MRGLTRLCIRRALGLVCVTLGAGLLTLSSNSLITSCADGMAHANGEQTGPPAPPYQSDLPTVPSSAEQATGPAESSSAQAESVADDDPAIVEPAEAAAQMRESSQQAPPRRLRRQSQAAPAAPSQPAGPQPPAPAAPSSAAGANSGFAELEQGWPAAAQPLQPSTADEQQQLVANTPLSEEARRLAGRWVAAVINKDGAARLLASEDEWVFNLGLDARCTARQRLDGKYWEQSGWWQLQGEALTLSLGPGGVWVFALQQHSPDIAVWRRAIEQTGGANFTLFCVRSEQGKMPPGLAPRYNSDFGPLRFEPSGPGRWRASFGDPLGKLNVARVGGFLAGVWEQQPGMGFVLFSLRSDGNSGAAAELDGVWWYSGSTSFDGKWAARQAK